MKSADYDALPTFDWDRHRTTSGVYKTYLNIAPYWERPYWDQAEQVTLIRVSVGFDDHFTISSYNERLE